MMIEKSERRLKLSHQTLRRLDRDALRQVNGGITILVTALECTQHTCQSDCVTECRGQGFTCGRTCTLEE